MRSGKPLSDYVHVLKDRKAQVTLGSHRHLGRVGSVSGEEQAMGKCPPCIHYLARKRVINKAHRSVQSKI